MKFCALLGFLVHVSISEAQPKVAPSTPTPLTSVALVADIDTPPDADDPGTGGGFDLGTYFQTRLADAQDIQACVEPVEQAANQWAVAQGLTKGSRDQSATALTVHYVKTGLRGFFSLTYRIEQQVKARARVDYIALDGTRSSPELARDLIATYQIAGLEDALEAALKCKGRAS